MTTANAQFSMNRGRLLRVTSCPSQATSHWSAHLPGADISAFRAKVAIGPQAEAAHDLMCCIHRHLAVRREGVWSCDVGSAFVNDAVAIGC